MYANCAALLSGSKLKATCASSVAVRAHARVRTCTYSERPVRELSNQESQEISDGRAWLVVLRARWKTSRRTHQRQALARARNNASCPLN